MLAAQTTQGSFARPLHAGETELTCGGYIQLPGNKFPASPSELLALRTDELALHAV